MIQFSPSASPVATVIVVGLRPAPHLVDCLRSLHANVRNVSYEVRLVLCDPTPELEADLERSVRGIEKTTFRANLGFAAAVNFAARSARGDYIVLLNDDSLVEAGWLEELVELAERRPRCGLVTSRFLNLDGSLQEAGSILWADGTTNAVGDGQEPDYLDFERRIDYGSGGSLLVKKDVWGSVGGLNEAFYPAYYEDVDFSLEAAEQGWEIWYQPRSVVRHRRSASTGALIRSFLFENARRVFTVRWGHVLSQYESDRVLETAIWRAMGRPVRVLVIDDQVPDPKRGSGLARMRDTLSALAEATDIHVAFVPRMTSRECSEPFPIRGVRVVLDLDRHLATPGIGYDVVVVSRPHNAEIYRDLLDRCLPEAAIVYDAEALFHRRLELQVQHAEPDKQAAIAAEAADMKQLEASVMRWADRVVCISDAEAAICEGLTGSAIDVVGPSLSHPAPSRAGFSDRWGIGLVAGWAAGPGSPNADGLLWFAHQILPKIAARVPSARLLVTGANPPSEVRWLAGDTVHFIGEVEDLAEFYDQIRVVISPTRFGSGVKLKTVEAVQYAVPVVSTEEAAAGLPRHLRAAVWVGLDADTFASAVVDLLSNERAWSNQRHRCLVAAAEDATYSSTDGARKWPQIVRSLSQSQQGEH